MNDKPVSLEDQIKAWRIKIKDNDQAPSEAAIREEAIKIFWEIGKAFGLNDDQILDFLNDKKPFN